MTIVLLRFNLDDDSVPVDELELQIDPDSNAAAGRTFEAGAFQWWADRADMRDVFARRSENMFSLTNALLSINDFFNVNSSTRLWVMGGSFETAIMNDVYQRFGMDPPWNNWDVSCGRTLCDLAAWLAQSQVDPTVHGDDLLATARYRLRALRFAYAKLLQRVDRRSEPRTGT